MSVALEGREARAGKKRGFVKLAGEGIVVGEDGEMVDGGWVWGTGGGRWRKEGEALGTKTC